MRRCLLYFLILHVEQRARSGLRPQLVFPHGTDYVFDSCGLLPPPAPPLLLSLNSFEKLINLFEFKWTTRCSPQVPLALLWAHNPVLLSPLSYRPLFVTTALLPPLSSRVFLEGAQETLKKAAPLIRCPPPLVLESRTNLIFLCPPLLTLRRTNNPIVF